MTVKARPPHRKLQTLKNAWRELLRTRTNGGRTGRVHDNREGKKGSRRGR